MKSVLYLSYFLLVNVCTFSQEFELSILSQNISVLAGEKVIVPLKITPTNGFLSSVYLSLSTGSASTPISFSTSTVNAPYDTVFITVHPNEYDSGYKTFSIIGKNGPVQRSVDFSVYVQYNPIRKWFKFYIPQVSSVGAPCSPPSLDKNGDICIFKPGKLTSVIYHITNNRLVSDTLVNERELIDLSTLYNSSILYDNSNNIFISLYNGGLTKYDGKFYTNSPFDNSIGKYTSVQRLFKTDNNEIMCLVGKDSMRVILTKYNGTSGVFERVMEADSVKLDQSRYSVDRKNNVYDKYGTLYSRGNYGGFVKTDVNSSILFNSSNSGLKGEYISTIKQDLQGRIWFIHCNTGDTIASVLDGNNWSYVKGPSCVSNIYFAKNGDYYVASNQGFFHFNGINWINYDEEIALNSIPFYPYPVFQEDKFGNIWIYTGSSNSHRVIIVFNPYGIKNIDGNLVDVERDESNEEIRITPNPGNNEMTFSVGDYVNVPIAIYNTLGESVYTQQSITEDVTLNTSILSSGIYFCKIGTMVKLFVIQH
ncbi:MAG: T9SS type A sorting domain-containing protein [Candidatus Kapaibacterium sp.]